MPSHHESDSPSTKKPQLLVPFSLCVACSALFCSPENDSRNSIRTSSSPRDPSTTSRCACDLKFRTMSSTETRPSPSSSVTPKRKERQTRKRAAGRVCLGKSGGGAKGLHVRLLVCITPTRHERSQSRKKMTTESRLHILCSTPNLPIRSKT